MGLKSRLQRAERRVRALARKDDATWTVEVRYPSGELLSRTGYRGRGHNAEVISQWHKKGHELP